jgi:hypothetical protein
MEKVENVRQRPVAAATIPGDVRACQRHTAGQRSRQPAEARPFRRKAGVEAAMGRRPRGPQSPPGSRAQGSPTSLPGFGPASGRVSTMSARLAKTSSPRPVDSVAVDADRDHRIARIAGTLAPPERRLSGPPLDVIDFLGRDQAAPFARSSAESSSRAGSSSCSRRH